MQSLGWTAAASGSALQCRSASLSLPQETGCIVLSSGGGILASMEDGIYRLAEDGSIAPAHPKTQIAGSRFNDGKVGPDGRLYVGTMRREGGGEFYRLDAEGSLESLFGDVRISNGLDWSPDLSTLYYCDTPTRRIDAFDFDANSGELRNRRPVIFIPEGMGSPDGLTIDAHGNLWIALWNGGAIVKADPRSGLILDRIEIPAARPTCCAFAGPELDELYITSASLDSLPSEEPLAGCLFRIVLDVPGRAPFRFG
jgi:sugar lactone lactonase YvrE